MNAIRGEGERIWAEIEGEIGLRNAAGYDQAVSILTDLRSVSEEDGTLAAYTKQLDAICERHSRKHGFLSRLKDLRSL